MIAAALGAAALAFAAPVAAECLPAPPEPELVSVSLEEDAASGATRADQAGRVIAPVMVNGQGPYRFIVDTGANRSALSRGLAEQLGAPSEGMAEVHTIDGVSIAPLVSVDSIEFGGMAVDGAAMPILDSGVLGGADGLLGVDGMRGRRLTMDFHRRCIEIAASATARRLSGWNTVEGELHFGHLVLIEGRVRGRRINILLDTGAGTTLANNALREQLAEVAVRAEVVGEARVRAYTAGAPIVLDTALIIPRLGFGEIEARNVLAYVGDFHIFDVWGLRDEPTLLLGMDALSQVRGVSIDFATGTVRFRFAEQLRTGSRLPGGANSSPSTTVSR